MHQGQFSSDTPTRPTRTDDCKCLRRRSQLVSPEQPLHTYTGREWDNDIQQYHYRARMYDPALGRFCSRDPIGYVDGPSVYHYVANSPLESVDPTGTVTILCGYSCNKRHGSGDSGWKEVECQGLGENCCRDAFRNNLNGLLLHR